MSNVAGGSILLHPTLGINPRLTFCRYCGSDEGTELMFLGIKNYVDKCVNPACGMEHIGGSNRRGKCMACGYAVHRRELTPGEKLPSESPCAKCAANMKAVDDAVAEGGIYWRCEGCGATGAFTKDSDLAKKVRHDSQTTTEPVGVTFPKDCPNCAEKEGDENKEES